MTTNVQLFDEILRDQNGEQGRFGYWEYRRTFDTAEDLGKEVLSKFNYTSPHLVTG
jgi:hypothetical protein